MSLPDRALSAVLLHLPLDDRMRCAEVYRVWRAMLAERSLWMHLDVASAAHPSDSLLRAAAARALRNVRSLDVSGVLQPAGGVTIEALCEVAAQNVGLRTLRSAGGAGLDVATLRRLLQTAPRLQELHADVAATAAEAPELARRAAPFATLRMRRLSFAPTGPGPLDDLQWLIHAPANQRFFNPPPAFQAEVWYAAKPLLRLLQEHPACCTGLLLPKQANHYALLLASAEAAIAAKLTSLSWWAPGEGSAALLTRVLLENAGLRQLHIQSLFLNCEADPQAPSRMALNELCNALRSSCLTSLTLCETAGPAGHHHAIENAGMVFCALAAALAGHPTLQELRLSVALRLPRLPPDAPQPGLDAALASLLTAPSLTSLDLSGCCFLDAELAPLVAALPQSPNLRVLDVRGSELRPAFVRDVLKPAAEAAALTELRLYNSGVVYGYKSPSDSGYCGLERDVAAAAAVRGQRFIFRAEHEALCRVLPGDGDTQAPLVRALKNSTSLMRCVLGGPFASATKRITTEDVAEVLRALIAHPTLEALTLEGDLRASAEVLGDLLGHIVAADAPLESFRCAGCRLGDAGLGPLVEALPRNTRLRRLECSGNKLTAAFTREVLLPAVQENAGLEHLSAADVLYVSEAAVAAAALVNARGARA